MTVFLALDFIGSGSSCRVSPEIVDCGMSISQADFDCAVAFVVSVGRGSNRLSHIHV